jgi:hypothetical protein
MEKPITFTLGGVSADIKLDELVLFCKNRGLNPKFIVQCNPQDYFGGRHPKISYVRTTIATPRGYITIGEDPDHREEWV